MARGPVTREKHGARDTDHGSRNNSLMRKEKGAHRVRPVKTNGTRNYIVQR